MKESEMEVIPIPLYDLTLPARKLRTRTFFIVNAVLDEQLLRETLDLLIRHHWRKLGGRIIEKHGRQAEYHVPRQFDEDHALFQWTSKRFDHSINLTAAPIRYPTQDEGPLFLAPIRTVDGWFRPADWPYGKSDDGPNTPFLLVHLSVFSDATVIAISIPHIVADQMGLSNIIKAWLGLVHGRGPPAMVGYEGDILPGSGKAYKDYPRSQICRKGRQRVRRWGEYLFVLWSFIPELVMHPKEELCVLFLPLNLVQSVKNRIIKQIQGEHGDCAKISDGDVITAILVKFSRMYHKKPQMVTISQTINLRGVVPELEPEKHEAFIHNALHAAQARLRLDPSTPLSEIAYANRKAIQVAKDAYDIEIGMGVGREMARRGQSMHTCEPFEQSYAVVNWCAAWRGLDFSPAIKPGAELAAKPAFLVLGTSLSRDTPQRFHSMILSRTEQGYWIDFGAATRTMESIKEYLKRDPNLEEL